MESVRIDEMKKEIIRLELNEFTCKSDIKSQLRELRSFLKNLEQKKTSLQKQIFKEWGSIMRDSREKLEREILSKIISRGIVTIFPNREPFQKVDQIICRECGFKSDALEELKDHIFENHITFSPLDIDWIIPYKNEVEYIFNEMAETKLNIAKTQSILFHNDINVIKEQIREFDRACQSIIHEGKRAICDIPLDGNVRIGDKRYVEPPIMEKAESLYLIQSSYCENYQILKKESDSLFATKELAEDHAFDCIFIDRMERDTISVEYLIDCFPRESSMQRDHLKWIYEKFITISFNSIHNKFDLNYYENCWANRQIGVCKIESVNQLENLKFQDTIKYRKIEGFIALKVNPQNLNLCSILLEN